MHAGTQARACFAAALGAVQHMDDLKALATTYHFPTDLYDALRVVMPSPVVDLNRAVAHSMAFGPEAGLMLIEGIDCADALRDYAPLPAAKGDFLFRAGRLAEARVQFERAASLSRNAREKAFLLGRAEACGG